MKIKTNNNFPKIEQLTQIIIYNDQRIKPIVNVDHLVPLWGNGEKCADCGTIFQTGNVCERMLRGGDNLRKGVAMCIRADNTGFLTYSLENPRIPAKKQAEAMAALRQAGLVK